MLRIKGEASPDIVCFNFECLISILFLAGVAPLKSDGKVEGGKGEGTVRWRKGRGGNGICGDRERRRVSARESARESASARELERKTVETERDRERQRERERECVCAPLCVENKKCVIPAAPPM